MKRYKSPNGVLKFKFGEMIPTETIVGGNFEIIEEASTIIDARVQKIEDRDSMTWSMKLESEDVVYGLGQNVRGMNKRGFIYEAFCSDDPTHSPDKKSLYGAHNFFVVQGEKTYGLYIDFAGRVKYDVAFTNREVIEITVDGIDFDVYYFTGTYKEIVKAFRSLIGLSYVPPKWAFGYQQSRWSYEDAKTVMAIADKFDDEDIPCDAIYLDIDYMERFKDFTISEERFPAFKNFVNTLKERDIKLVPIIDAGVKIEEGYDVYEEGVQNGYFCKDETGEPFVAAVWPGKVHFPDVLNEDARKWFGDKYHALMDLGIDGFWNDMNEPAIFYSEQGLKEAIAFVKEQEGKNLDIHTFFKLKDKIYQLSNATKDYQSLYHQMGDKRLNHYDVHNLYGYNITRAAAEGFERYDANKRFFLLTRASHIGMAKHSGIWTGDNHAWWEHLKLNIQMMPALNMAGFLYTGADTGGFGGDASAELLTRWVQFSMFTPLLRNHSAMGTRVQEPWQFDAPTTKALRDTIRMRYAFIPYIYSEYMKANLSQDLMFAPLSYSYDEKRTRAVEDQLLFGESIMLTPVYEQNAKGRYVYLPEKMAKWKIKNFEALVDRPFELMEKGDHYVPLEIDEFAVFLRPNKLTVLTKPENRVSKLDVSNLVVIGYVNDFAHYNLYDDDGISNAFKVGNSKMTTFKVAKTQESYQISVDTNVHSLNTVTFYLIDDTGKCHVLTQGNPNANPTIA